MLRPACALLLLLACATATGAQDGAARFFGYAYHLDSGRYAFTEVLEQRAANGQWVHGTSVYYLPDGREFGRKTLDFTRDPFLPVYRLQLDSGYAEGISDNGDPIVMGREAGGKARTSTIARDGLTTADSGLPRLLRARLDALGRGEPLAFRVVAPSRLASYRFRARAAGEVEFEGQRAARIQVDMDSMLKLFAGPLFFTFDAGSGRLLEFRGQTNVIDPATGEPFVVRISYFSVPPADAPALKPWR
jgi:hypothetical protein